MRKAGITGLALVLCLIGSVAVAANGTFDYDALAALRSVADNKPVPAAKPPAAKPAPAADTAYDGCCEDSCAPSCCDSAGCGGGCAKSCAPWSLPQPCCLQQHGI